MDYNLLGLFRHATDTVTFAAGQTIFEVGQPRDYMYVILEGSVDIYVHDKVIENAQAGSAVGEMALIDNSPRSAKAVAHTDVRLAPIDQNRFTYMVQETPFFALKIMHIMAERLRARNT